MTARAGNAGPSYSPGPANGGVIETNYGKPPRPLNQRFSSEVRFALAAAFASGVKQKDLAREYGISIRSVKRLVQEARKSGVT